MTDSSEPDLSRPCPGCGARRFDLGRFFDLYGLCDYCFRDPAERAAATIVHRTLKPPPCRPLPPHPTSHIPGSEEKAEVIRWRLEQGYALSHPADATMDDADGTEGVKNAPDPIHPDDLFPGVEMDRSKGKIAWRARPRWRDCRVRMGRFAEYSEAVAAVKQFYADRWGEWDEARPWLRLPACLAVVRLDAGWHDLEFPADAPKSLARIAAGLVLAREPYPSFWAAEAALRRELESLTAA